MLPNRIIRHLRNNNISYLSHFKKALKISIKMFIGSIFSIIHGVFPFLFETSATDIAREITRDS